MRLSVFLFILLHQPIIYASAVETRVNDMEKKEAIENISAHQFEFISIDGVILPLTSFSGKALLVVNTASRCGFTSQYEGLQSLWEKYRDQGLVVLGVPSNDFLGQEPGTESEIKNFCTVKFNVDFPMTSKVHVKGKDAHPFYAWAKEKSGGPRWNFHKYLLDREGKFVAAYSSITDPLASKVIKAVELTLGVVDRKSN